jgi:hypothetical protein
MNTEGSNYYIFFVDDAFIERTWKTLGTVGSGLRCGGIAMPQNTENVRALSCVCPRRTVLSIAMPLCAIN